MPRCEPAPIHGLPLPVQPADGSHDDAWDLGSMADAIARNTKGVKMVKNQIEVRA